MQNNLDEKNQICEEKTACQISEFDFYKKHFEYIYFTVLYTMHIVLKQRHSDKQ